MDFAWFHDLGLLARTGHFSRAARLAHVSQPAFSRRIKQLEAWVGTSLVDRRTHPVTLTIAGAQMLEAGLQALERIEHERRQIRDAEALPDRYVVTFGMPHSIGWRFYPDWLKTFEQRCGPVMSRMRADDLPNCIDALGKGDVDFVIAYRSRYADGMDKLPTVESIAIGIDALIPVCKPGPDGLPLFRFDDGRSSIPWLRFGPTASMTRHLEPLLELLGVTGQLSVMYENSMAGALRIRARDGAGVAWLPRSLVQPDLDSGLLALTGEATWSLELEIRLYRLRDAANAVTRDVWTNLVGERVITTAHATGIGLEV